MNKLQTSNSNASGKPTDVSESQSFKENQNHLLTGNQSAALNRAKNSWKRMKELAAEKENDVKRPPWRAVSVSTLPKPDKNALLRAKLLDASRRLRAGKNNVSIQTDFQPTKLMKEANLGAQYDLILRKDVGILTDGQYSKKNDGNNQYVLTYSVSQMTDTVVTADVLTQTLLPKAFNDNVISSFISDVSDNGIVVLSDVEKRVTNQIAKMRSLLINEGDTRSPVEGRSNINIALKPTLASWRFEDEVIEIDDAEVFIPYTIESRRPWRSFVPFPFRLSGKFVGSQRIDWYALLQSVDDLIEKSNDLVDKLEQIMKNKNEHRVSALESLSLTDTGKIKPNNFISPSEHWLPIINQQEKQLQIIIKRTEDTRSTIVAKSMNYIQVEKGEDSLR